MASTTPASPDCWHHLRRLTAARIALGRAGGSLPTCALLEFQLAHAQARDAVHTHLDADKIVEQLEKLKLPAMIVHSDAADGLTYLKRPDLGRQVSPASWAALGELQLDPNGYDLAIIVADGLCATAAQQNAVPLIEALRAELAQQGQTWSIAPVVVVRHGRVAIQDPIGQKLGATIALILIGERPGLGTSDSLGAYLVFGPQPGRTDAQRNCVSNIRPQGLAIAEAAKTLGYLLAQSHSRQISGVELKDDRPLIEPASGAAAIE